jgi:asparagine synthase (glutamine-hydrolysing)
MCGIAGTFQQPDGQDAAMRMNDRIAHRGPDDEGLYSYTDERVSAHLAHRRLSIIDLAHGQQPFIKRGLALVYNGELYNFKDLRAELVAMGADFVTTSDTEVVLEAWRQWGPGCLARFRGMFAFALFEEQSGRLFLARDHLGIKPLYFMQRGRGIAFASELKALLAAYGDELSVDPTALVASILYYWVPDRRCSVAGVKRVPPGSWIEIRPDGQMLSRCFWDPAAVAADAAAGPPADLRSEIEQAVRAHLVADVPVGTFLSGGLDSSIVSVLAKRDLAELDAYTITFRESDFRLEAMPDDAVYARKVASMYGIRLHEIEIAPQVADLLPRMVDILDEPIGDPAAINTLLMCEAARHAGVKVLLSGMGADEMFGGYRKHVACMLAARYQRLPGVARSAVAGVIDSLPVTAGGRGLRYARWAKRFGTFANLPEEAAFRRSYTLYDQMELASLLGPDLAPAIDDVLSEHEDLYFDNNLSDHVNRMCLTDSRHFLPGLNLTYTDRASMAASTEVRTPFVDPLVFKAAFSLRGDQKVHGRTAKAALKTAAQAWLPDEIVHRPKASFSAPLRAWISQDLRPLIDDVLLNGELVSTGFLQADALTQLVADDRAGREDRSKQVWQLLTLELWYRQSCAAGVSV